MDIIKEKQQLWAQRHGKNMRTDYKFYTNTVEENLFKNLYRPYYGVFVRPNSGYDSFFI